MQSSTSSEGENSKLTFLLSVTWPRIKLIAVDAIMASTVDIIDIEGDDEDLFELQTWIYKNRNSIIEQMPPNFLSASGSVSKRISEFYSRIDADELPDYIFEELYDYRSSHCFKFSVRGYDVIADWVVAKIGNLYELSSADLNQCYYVDIESLLRYGIRI